MQRLLQPGDVQIVHFIGSLNRRAHVPSLVGVEHQLDLRTDGVAHGFDPLIVGLNRVAAADTADLQFDGVVTLLKVAFHLLHELRDSLAFAVVAARHIGRNARSIAA